MGWARESALGVTGETRVRPRPSTPPPRCGVGNNDSTNTIPARDLALARWRKFSPGEDSPLNTSHIANRARNSCAGAVAASARSPARPLRLDPPALSTCVIALRITVIGSREAGVASWGRPPPRSMPEDRPRRVPGSVLPCPEQTASPSPVPAEAERSWRLPAGGGRRRRPPSDRVDQAVARSPRGKIEVDDPGPATLEPMDTSTVLGP